MSSRKRGAKPPQSGSKQFVAPAMPPLTEKEQRFNATICDRLRELTIQLRQRNLDNAVLLAQMAARGHGPLVDHFQELGRRYAELLREPPAPDLRVIDGGKQA